MKCIVIYSSQTGNTKKVARAIQLGVKQAAGAFISNMRFGGGKHAFAYSLYQP